MTAIFRCEQPFNYLHRHKVLGLDLWVFESIASAPKSR